MAANATDVVALPDELGFEQGAAIPVNYGTAWAGLIGYGNLQAGERVLIHSAGGGVGIAATQIAKRVGVEVYGTASPGKHARCIELGVDHVLDYTKPGWESGLPKFDVIMDAVGGPSFRRSYNLLRPGGRLVAFGASAVVSGERKNVVTALRAVARMPRFNLIKQMSESKAVIGLNMLSLWKDRGTLEPWIGPLQEMLARRHDQTGRGRGLQLHGHRRSPEHDHRAAERRQGGARPLRRSMTFVMRRPRSLACTARHASGWASLLA